MAAIELKKVRTTCDFKVILYQEGKRKWGRILDFNPKSDNIGLSVMNGSKMDRSMSDNDVILETLKQFAMSNITQNLRDNPQKDQNFYKITQDPWLDNPPEKRKYGITPYYLNNKCSIYIKWLSGSDVKTSDSDDADSTIDKDISIVIPDGITRINKTTGKFDFASKVGDNYMIYSTMKDSDLVNYIIQQYKSEIISIYGDNNYNLELCNPDTQSCSVIPFKSPITPPVDPISGTTASVTADKIKLTLIGLSDFIEVKAKQDLPNFTVYVGEPPKSNQSVDSDDSNDSDEFNDEGDWSDEEYVENSYQGPEEEAIVIDGETLILFSNSELRRDDNPTVADGGGVETGGSNVVVRDQPVSASDVILPADLKNVKNSSILTKQSMGNGYRGMTNDIRLSNGAVITGSNITRSMNEFIRDALGPFATFLRTRYPNLYKSLNINSATRGYVPKGGSTTSQHMMGQAIDMQILGSNLKTPQGNIDLLNAILEWYKINTVGYGQILFETRGSKSCWIHWSYSRGNKKLQLLRFKDDKTLHSASINTTGKYVLPTVGKSQLGLA
jgi:hypothetical protein